MALRFYNTLTRNIDVFKPINEGKATLYTCGPTVYNMAHIGNFRAYICEDLLRRWLEYRGYEVKHVMNLTDVDDKTIKNSIKENMSLSDYTAIYKKAFMIDVESLNMEKAHIYPSATEYIKQMINMIKELLDKGFAYETDDGVYFRVSSFHDYGNLAHLDKSGLQAGASGRVANDEYSRDEVSDFALWKKWSKDDGDVKWPSPFGEGRPGWHIECSAMSRELLGETIDIHCGGIDNMFPHHENEIAQSESFSGKKFVNYWFHIIHLIVDGEKMSKSKGNFYTLHDLIEKGYSSRSVRYALITTHYRKPLNFTFDLLKQADSSLKRIDEFVYALGSVTNDGPEFHGFTSVLDSNIKLFEESLDDDLNISEAMSAIFNIINSFYENRLSITKDNSAKALDFLKKADCALGFIHPKLNLDIGLREKNLIEERNSAKAMKDFARADEIRALLLSEGIELRDTKEGTTWKKIS